MTATKAPARPAPVTNRTGLAAARLLRLELRHNAMLWMMPVAVALFWVAAGRKIMATPPLWSLRAAGLQPNAVTAGRLAPATTAGHHSGPPQVACCAVTP